MNGKRWCLIFLGAFCAGIAAVFCGVTAVDPFFHFHAPKTDTYFYRLSNERSQNDGITRHFDYSGLITGTSVTENFRASEAEELFSGSFIKIPYAGASFREVNEGVSRALARNPKLKTVIRGLDLECILDPENFMNDDMGVRPEYLYDDDCLNDVYYVLNRDVFFSWTCRMLDESIKKSVLPGVTDFDEYSSWRCPPSWYGASEVYPDGFERLNSVEQIHLSREQEEGVRANVRHNITELADRYPEDEFICFIPPNSMAWWYDKAREGSACSIVEAEKIMMEEILQHANIRLFSWNDRIDIIGNLDNYADTIHYGEWINDLILQNISEGNGLITRENYEAITDFEMYTFLNFDYPSLQAAAHTD